MAFEHTLVSTAGTQTQVSVEANDAPMGLICLREGSVDAFVYSWTVSSAHTGIADPNYIRVGLCRLSAINTTGAETSVVRLHDANDASTLPSAYFRPLVITVSDVLDTALVRSNGGILYREYLPGRAFRKKASELMGLVLLDVPVAVDIRASFTAKLVGDGTVGGGG